MASILTLALNPTIDVASECDIVRPVHKIRTANETYEPGGGGVNVARVIAELGGDVEVLCMAGGVTGAFLDQLLGEIPLRRRMVAKALEEYAPIRWEIQKRDYLDLVGELAGVGQRAAERTRRAEVSLPGVRS